MPQIHVPGPSERRQMAAADILKAAAGWEPFRGPTGKLFYRVPGSRPGTSYTVCTTSCSCPDAAQRGSICKHMRSVRLLTSAVRAFLGHRRKYRQEYAP